MICTRKECSAASALRASKEATHHSSSLPFMGAGTFTKGIEPLVLARPALHANYKIGNL